LLFKKRQIDMSKFGITFSVPASTVNDVASREVLVKFTNPAGDNVVKTLQGNAVVTEEYVLDDGQTVQVAVRDTDQKGNVGPYSPMFEYNVVDDVAPPAPGMVGVSAKRQIDEPPVTP
jgi:hypothetical protein